MSHWDLAQFDGKAVVFIGQGQGRSAAGVHAFLEKHTDFKSFTGVDAHDNTDPWGFLTEYDPVQTVFIKNEGVPGSVVPVPYIAPMQLFFELLSAVEGVITVGVTGTKGKSTTTSLLAAMLRESGRETFLCGNIGTSVFEYLDQAHAGSVFVVELSSYQLSDLHTSPHISVCINLFFDHVDWHGSREAYWEAKHNIMRYAGPDDFFVYSPDYPALLEWAKNGNCQTIAFSADEEIDMSHSNLLGEHNRLNAIAARAASLLADATPEGVQKALDTFKPLEHRLQIVTNREGVTYIDDGIATTPEATLAALAAITSRIGSVGCLMLGGEDRGYNFSELLARVADLNIANLVLFPDSGERIREELPVSYKPTILVSRDMDEAVRFAAANTVSGECVLLSTASPSYSIWPQGFEQKGAEFQAAIGKL